MRTAQFPLLLLSLAASTVLLAAKSPLAAAEHRAQPLKEAAPADVLAKEIQAQLADEGFRVLRGTKRVVCDIWPAKEWPLAADFKPTGELLYPFRVGQFLGVLRFKYKSPDFRDQSIPAGVYTMRYAQQPVDGNHVGTSPTRDFVLLVRAEDDKTVAPIEYKKLAELSKTAAESSHPALLPLRKVDKPADKPPAMHHDEEHDWWVLEFAGTGRAGEKTASLNVRLLVAGVAAE